MGRSKKAQTISEVLLAEAKATASVYRLAKDTLIPQPTLHRFMAGQTMLGLRHADRLAEHLGLRLVKVR